MADEDELSRRVGWDDSDHEWVRIGVGITAFRIRTELVPDLIKRLQELYDETDTLEPSDDDN